MNFDFQRILFILPGILLGLTVHEFCHAFAAYKLGDHTAREMGRLSFNPIKHIDPIGFLFIILAGFGWAKPVMFNPEKLRDPRRDKAIIAAAGPLSNLLLALLLAGFVWLWYLLPNILASPENEALLYAIVSSQAMVIFMTTVYYGAMINLGLFVFNLFPIPPLDGSHIVFSGLNLDPQTELSIMKIGAPLLFLILIIQNRTGLTILPIGRIISGMLDFIMPF